MSTYNKKLRVKLQPFFLHWAAATLKRLVEFQKKKLDHFSPSYLTQQDSKELSPRPLENAPKTSL